MGSSVLNIGISGLSAAQAGLVTTGHNIANASTPGYSRQSIVQGTNVPVFSGVGYFGQGTNVETVKRAYNDYLTQQVRSADARYQELNAHYEQVKQIDDLFGDPAAGLSPSIQDFFRGVQEVAAGPNSAPARQSMLSQANALVSRFETLNTRLDELRTLVGGEIAGAVVEINSFARQVAELNQRIIVAGNIGSGQPPNDLLDQRNDLIAQLNQQVGVSVLENEDGSVNVFVGNGQPLVVRSTVSELTTQPSNDDISRLAVGIKLPNGQSQQLSEAALAGGKLTGLLAFRRESLDEVQNALGRIAIGLTETFNAQHRRGQDLNGALGTDFFVPLQGKTIYPNNPVNGGTAQIDVPISNVADLTTSDYTLSYIAANTYQLVRRADSQVWTAAGTDPTDALNQLMAAVPSQGFSLTLAAGTPNVGDSFLIQPTRFGAQEIATAFTEPGQIAAASPIRTRVPNSNTGTANIDQGTVTDVSNLVPPAALALPLSLTFSGGNLSGFPAGFDVSVTAPDGTVTNYAAPVGAVTYVDGGKIAFAGVTVTISGKPGAGDVFSLEANTAGVADSRNAVALGALQQARTLVGGGASYQSAYAQLVSEIGANTREVQVTSEAQAKVLERTQDAQGALSGVNLDEEGANLIRYQQAYQASGKVMEIASRLFDEILGLGR